MATESTVQRNVWLALARRALARVTLFRANSGKAWLSGGGKVEVDARGTAHVPFARPVALGLALTSGDTVRMLIAPSRSRSRGGGCDGGGCAPTRLAVRG